MNAAFLGWWRIRTLREQRMLLAMAALLALVLAWLLVVRPLDNALATARSRHARAVIALAQAEGQARAITALQQSAPRLAGPIPALVQRAASDAGFDARVIPEGADSVSLSIDAVSARAFFGWTARMEALGLVVERLSARANSDATLSVRVGFRGRR